LKSLKNSYHKTHRERDRSFIIRKPGLTPKMNESKVKTEEIFTLSGRSGGTLHECTTTGRERGRHALTKEGTLRFGRLKENVMLGRTISDAKMKKGKNR